MKLLVFHIGRERYALPLATVLRVLPVARLRPLPGAPHYVPGLLDLHGEPVPVVDLSRLAGSPPDAVRYDTRILLLDFPLNGAVRRLGLKAERVAGVASIAGPLADSGVVAAGWLGAVASIPDGAGGDTGSGTAGSGLLHLIEPARLLAPEVAAQLFGAVAHTEAP